MTSQIVYPPPPPTTNLINGKHRLRLMRSTRKLGAVLGTVAQLSEPNTKLIQEVLPIGVQHCRPRPSTSSESSCSSSIKSSRRQGSVFTTSPSTPELICTSASPMSSTSSLALSEASVPSLGLLDTPRPSKPSSKRKNRPTELPQPLILRLNAVPTRFQTAPSTPQTIPSTPGTADTLTPQSPLTPTPTTPVSPTPSETRRKRMAKLTRTLGERIPPHLITFATKSKKLSTPSLKSTFDLPGDSTPLSGRGGRRRSMSVDFGAETGNSQSPYSRSSRIWVTEHPSWRGEWNRRDIKDVQTQLRSLKAR